MPNENWSIQLQRIERGAQIVGKLENPVTSCRSTRSTESSARDANDAEFVGELRCELIEDVGRVADTGQEQDGSSLSSPID